MSAWYQPGSATLTSGSRLVPTTIINAVNITDNTTTSSTSVDVSNYISKSFKITLTSTGTMSDYRVQIKCSASDVNANFAEIVSEIYEADGVYHWYIEDAGKWIMIDVTSWGTADIANYVTVSVTIEGSAA